MGFLFSGFLLSAILLETTIFTRFFPADIKPDLFLCLTVYTGLFLSPAKGLSYGLVAGAMLDIFSEGVIGPNTLFLMSLGLLSGYVRNYVLVENPLVQAATIIVSTLFQWIISFVYAGTFQVIWSPLAILNFLQQFGYFLFLQVIFNFIFIFPVFWLFNLFRRKEYRVVHRF